MKSNILWYCISLFSKLHLKSCLQKDDPFVQAAICQITQNVHWFAWITTSLLWLGICCLAHGDLQTKSLVKHIQLDTYCAGEWMVTVDWCENWTELHMINPLWLSDILWLHWTGYNCTMVYSLGCIFIKYILKFPWGSDSALCMMCTYYCCMRFYIVFAHYSTLLWNKVFCFRQKLSATPI